MPDRLQEIRARMDARGAGDGAYRAYIDFIAHAPTDIAWLIEQYEWMSKERDEVVDWLLSNTGYNVPVDEVLFKFGIINGVLEDGTYWSGTCSCNAKLREECYCGEDYDGI